MPEMKTFGQFAKRQLRSLGKSQKELARKLGVSPAYISQILTGKKNPPDLGKTRNRPHLRIWAQFMEVPEDRLLEVVRYQLHRVPPRPNARFDRMRRVLLSRISERDRGLLDEIRALELHPAENMAIQAMIKIFLVMQEEPSRDAGAYGGERFRDLAGRVKYDREFIEGPLTGFFASQSFTWSWNPEANEIGFISESAEIMEAIEKVRELSGRYEPINYGRTIPVVGHVSAGEGFEFTDGGYPAGEGFDRVEIPPGVPPELAQRLYCVRVRGESLREFINEGALLFIKPESWEEIVDGDLVIFKDREENRAFVKKVEFSGDSLILKSMNPLYKNKVLQKSELVMLERVMSILL